MDTSVSSISVSSILKTLNKTIESTTSASNTRRTAGTESGSAMPPPPGGVDISDLSTFLSNLESLKESDPEKYQELLSQAAEKIRALAEQIASESTSDTEESEMLQKMLNEMADRFENAATSGDVSQLLPPPPPPPDGQNAASGYGKYTEPPAASSISTSIQESLMEILNSLSEAVSS